MVKSFYDKQKNFSYRTLSEYYISPGIRCKFDLLKEKVNLNRFFSHGIDLGCSGNSFLSFLDNIKQKSFYDISHIPLNQYLNNKRSNPLCGDLARLPYKDKTFDFVSALDVLEHIKDDELAVSEISRIMKTNGLVIITVPHHMKYYSYQDQIIGHYRRYQIDELLSLFKKYNLMHLQIFGVYGKLMRIADIQSTNPERIEKNLINLRNKYELNSVFRKIWNIFVRIMSKIMKIDAKYHSLKNIMNIAIIFRKL